MKIVSLALIFTFDIDGNEREAKDFIEDLDQAFKAVYNE